MDFVSNIGIERVVNQQNLLSSQPDLKSDNNSKVLHPDNAEILSASIPCSPSSTVIQLQEVQQEEEHRRKCHWVLERIKFVSYPQPDFRL